MAHEQHQWASRFREKLADEALQFSSSVHIDGKLFHEDVAASIAHAEMLTHVGILTRDECETLSHALREIEYELGNGTNLPRMEEEDIHTAIEHRLYEKVGDVAGKLHTARSRNDQVATDERLWLRNEIDRVTTAIRVAQCSVLRCAERHSDVVIPFYTHLQRAQPVLAPHYYLAWIEMLERDIERFHDARMRVNRSPLGAAAGAGTSLPIDPAFTAELLGFDSILRNSIDAVSDRDYMIEVANDCAMTMIHLSRFCEDIILGSSAEFGTLELADRVTTGSSIMPQKKNPDMAELIRGKTGGVVGDAVALLTMMKGLPLSYNRDMQEDKEPVMHAVATVKSSLEIFALVVDAMNLNRERCAEIVASSALVATDIAEYLVEHGLPFRDAHRVTGKLVVHALDAKKEFHELSLAEFNEYSPLFDKTIFDRLTSQASVKNKKGMMSTSPEAVAKQLALWKLKCIAG